jgi:hypothetical protein
MDGSVLSLRHEQAKSPSGGGFRLQATDRKSSRPTRGNTRSLRNCRGSQPRPHAARRQALCSCFCSAAPRTGCLAATFTKRRKRTWLLGVHCPAVPAHTAKVVHGPHQGQHPRRAVHGKSTAVLLVRGVPAGARPQAHRHEGAQACGFSDEGGGGGGHGHANGSE